MWGSAIKTMKPQVRVIGVEPERVASFECCDRCGPPVWTEAGPTLADGLAVPAGGGQCLPPRPAICRSGCPGARRRSGLAVLRLVELEKAVVEGAGAAPLAACLAGLVPELKGKKVVLPLCGGNIDTTILGRVLERGLAHDGRWLPVFRND